MDIVARQKNVLEPLVTELIVCGSPDGKLIAEFFPIKAVKVPRLTHLVYFKEAGRVLHRWGELIKLLRCAVVIGYDRLAFDTVAMPKHTGKTLDVSGVFFRFFVYIAFDNESKSPVLIAKVELKAGLEVTDFFKRCNCRIVPLYQLN